MWFFFLHPMCFTMSNTVAWANQPAPDPSIDLTSQFSAMDDYQPKQKRKHKDPAKGKDGQLKIGDGIEDQEVLLPRSRLQRGKKKKGTWPNQGD